MNNNILKLAGMIYKPAYYTAEQWLEKTGVCPANYPLYFKSTTYGKYYVTDKFTKEYNARSINVSNNWTALGCSN